MTDIYDHASDVEQLERASILARQQQVAHQRAQLAAIVGSAEECHDCGELIPIARRQAVPGCTQCVVCASTQERQQRLAR